MNIFLIVIINIKSNCYTLYIYNQQICICVNGVYYNKNSMLRKIKLIDNNYHISQIDTFEVKIPTAVFLVNYIRECSIVIKHYEFLVFISINWYSVVE